MTSYVVVGAGAVGGVVGGRLRLAGLPTTLVARGAHLEAMRAQGGLRLDTADGIATVDAALAASAAEVRWDDDPVVLLAVKSHQTSAALEDLLAHAPADTPVFCLQNGVSNEREVLRRVPGTYAVCVMLPSTHLEPGLVVQSCHPVPGILDLGRVPTGADDRCAQVSTDLRRAGFESVPRPDVLAWKHRKLLMNLGNGVDATFRPGPAAEELVRLARSEGELVLAAAGIAVTSAEQDAERRGDLLRRRPDVPAGRGGSTWQSLARGSGSVEVDHLSGEIVLLGRWHDVPTPVNELVQRATRDLARQGGPPRSVDPEPLLLRLG